MDPSLNLLQKEPFLFQEYFESKEERASPFLSEEGRKWAYNLELRVSIVSAALLILSFSLSFFSGLLPLAMLLLTFVYFLSGIPSLIDAISDLTFLDINIDLLMTFAAFGSVLIGSPFEGALLLVLFSLSFSMEEAVRARAKSALRELAALAPTVAIIITKDKKTSLRSVRDVKIGEQILIRAGEIVPLDGLIVEGVSEVTLAHITGESLPLLKKKGDLISAGAKNMEGTFVVEVTHSAQDSTLAKIIDLVTQAEEAKPKLQLWLDRLTRTYSTTILLAFFLLLVFLPWISGISYLGEEGAIYRSLAFLIAASPCALVIAVPIAYLSSISAAAKKGILLKGGYILDLLCQIESILFDKTGTLTTGELTLLSVEGMNTSREKEEILSIASGLEMGAVHPIAKSIQKYCSELGFAPVPIQEMRAIPGFGVEGSLKDGTRLFIGRPDGRTNDKELSLRVEQLQTEGVLVSLLTIGTENFLFRFEDTLRKESANALKTLQDRFHLKTYMLTGDHKESALKIASKLSLTEVFYELRPENKLEIVHRLSQESPLAFVGDGVNDAPALKRADIGIGMGKTGSRSALEVSDIVLLQDNIELLPWLFSQAHFTSKIVRQNLIVATLAIIVASSAALFGLVPLWLAVIIHEGGTVSVGLNALRLLGGTKRVLKN